MNDKETMLVERSAIHILRPTGCFTHLIVKTVVVEQRPEFRHRHFRKILLHNIIPIADKLLYRVRLAACLAVVKLKCGGNVSMDDMGSTLPCCINHSS